MLLMHERNQRFLCRTAFVIFCALPTLALLSWILVFQFTGHISRYQKDLSDWLGCRVSIQRVRYLKPGVTVLERVQLADRETGQPMVFVPQLKITQSGKTLLIDMGSAEINQRQIALIPHWLDRQILQRWDDRKRILKFTIAKVDIVDGQELTILTDVSGLVEFQENGPQATLGFFIDGIDMSQIAQLRITRDLTEPLPQTLFEFHTGGAALPCRKIMPDLFGMQRWSAESLFQGSLQVFKDRQGWQGEIIQGSISQVELQTSTDSWTPYTITGPAKLTIRHAWFQTGRLQNPRVFSQPAQDL